MHSNECTRKLHSMHRMKLLHRRVDRPLILRFLCYLFDVSWYLKRLSNKVNWLFACQWYLDVTPWPGSNVYQWNCSIPLNKTTHHVTYTQNYIIAIIVSINIYIYIYNTCFTYSHIAPFYCAKQPGSRYLGPSYLRCTRVDIAVWIIVQHGTFEFNLHLATALLPAHVYWTFSLASSDISI